MDKLQHGSELILQQMPPPSSMSRLLLITLAAALSVAISGAKVPSDSECNSAYNSIGQDAMYAVLGYVSPIRKGPQHPCCGYPLQSQSLQWVWAQPSYNPGF